MGSLYCAINSPRGSRWGKNPETEGRGIFAPTADRVVSQFFHSFVDSCIGTICHHKDFTGRVLLWENFISPRNNLFHTQRRFFLARYKSLNGPHLLRMVQPIRLLENPGTTMVSIGHLSPWPEYPGYHTQVWDKCKKEITPLLTHCSYVFLALTYWYVPWRVSCLPATKWK